MGMVKEFKEFAVKGNVMDMAVGIVIGVAFGAIVTSFVADIIMPPAGLLLGGVDFTSLSITLKEATVDTEAVTLNYGNFIQTLLNFLVIAFSVFIVIKGINSMKKKEESLPEAPPAPSQEVTLLGEIRDLLRKE